MCWALGSFGFEQLKASSNKFIVFSCSTVVVFIMLASLPVLFSFFKFQIDAKFLCKNILYWETDFKVPIQSSLSYYVLYTINITAVTWGGQQAGWDWCKDDYKAHRNCSELFSCLVICNRVFRMRREMATVSLEVTLTLNVFVLIFLQSHLITFGLTM